MERKAEALNSAEFGGWLKAERKRQKMTVRELAEISGYGEFHIIAICCGRRNCSTNCMEDLAKSLGYRMEINMIREETDDSKRTDKP